MTLEETSANCGSLACLEVTRLDIDSSGEVTVFWLDRSTSSSTPAFKVGNASPLAALSKATIETSVNNISSKVVQLSSRRYLYLHQPSPVLPGAPIPLPPPGSTYTTQSRVVDLQSAGMATLSSPVAAPSTLEPTTTLVRDLSGNLTAIVTGTAAPFPQATLAGNVNVSLLTPAPYAFSAVDAQAYGDFDSIAPRGLWVVMGREQAGDVRSVYVHQLSLDTGSVLPSGAVSTGEVRSVAGSLNCVPAPRVKSPANAEFHATWTQVNASLNACDLMVDGQRVNDGTYSVGSYDTSGRSGGAIVAVWEERDTTPAGRQRLRFSTKDSTNAWSTPAPIEPSRDSAATTHVSAIASGPSGTLVVAWAPCVGTATSCLITERLISKYVNGSWTTRSLPEGTEVQALAINATGDGAAVVKAVQCVAGGTCSDVSVHRF